jgi:hypothetical protein
MSYCTGCGNAVADDSFCRNCGKHNFPQTSNVSITTGNAKRNGKLLWLGIAIVVVALLTVWGLGGGIQIDKEKAQNKFADHYRQCGDLTKSYLKYPSSFDYDASKKEEDEYAWSDNSGPDWGRITLHFTARNGLGIAVTGVAYCDLVKGQGQLTFFFAQFEDGSQVSNPLYR